MASQKQLEANRANSSRSTGPKSSAGKGRSRLNALKHGLTAETLVIGGEDPKRFEELRQQLMRQHDPATPMEAELVERLTGILWRLRRVPFFEASILAARQVEVGKQDKLAYRHSEEADNEDEDMSDEEWSVHVGNARIHDGAWGDALGKLSRHETTLMNAFTRQMLHVLQSASAERSGVKGTEVAIEPLRLTNGPRSG